MTGNINPGDFRDQVTFQNIIRQATADGGNLRERSAYKTVYAKVEDTSTFERTHVGRKEGHRVVKITTHYRDDITNTMGFEWNNQDYDIIAPIENVGQRNFIMIIKGELA